VKYCSKDHQAAHWKAEHKQNCPRQKSSSVEDMSASLTISIDNTIDTTALYNPSETSDGLQSLRKTALLPVYNIVIDAEELEDEDDYQKENELLKDYETRKQAAVDKGVDDDDDDCEGLGRLAPREKDLQFRRFRKRVGANPSQIIRFERKGEPLWVQTSKQCSVEQVPQCEHCGADRVFECQLMPQLLYYITKSPELVLAPSADNPFTPDSYLNAPGLDWGTVVLYTCSASCDQAVSKYVNEYVFVQPHYG
jgi:pre-rRNA-processing protein TSR4